MKQMSYSTKTNWTKKVFKVFLLKKNIFFRIFPLILLKHFLVTIYYELTLPQSFSKNYAQYFRTSVSRTLLLYFLNQMPEFLEFRGSTCSKLASIYCFYGCNTIVYLMQSLICLSALYQKSPSL